MKNNENFLKNGLRLMEAAESQDNVDISQKVKFP